MGNRLMVALGFGLALLAGACGDDDNPKPGGDSAVPGGDGSVQPRPDSGIPGIDGGGMDATTPSDGTTPKPDGNNPTPGDAGVSPGSDGMVMPQPGTAMKVITSAGGKLASTDGVLELTFPPNLFTRPIQVTIRAVANAAMTYPGASGIVYEVAPSAEPFSQQAQQRRVAVVYKYRQSDVGPGGPLALQVGTFRGGAWYDLTNVKAYTAGLELRGYVDRLAPIATYSGVCEACSETCTPETCKFPREGAGGVMGKCVAFGKGCGRCVPLCDADEDGFCPGSPGSDQPGGDCQPQNRNVHPEGAGRPAAPEICGNGIDDDCDQGVDEDCTPCSSATTCPEGTSCREGFCATCAISCNPSTCNFFAGEGVPPYPGRCVMRGATCDECVRACDQDADGYCPANSVGGTQEIDCDDANPAKSPVLPEICGNNIDDNCNGFIDDNCQECQSNSQCPVNTACVAGACVGCADACTPETCRFPAGSPSGVAGKCVAFGNMCERCVPACDDDGDGQCATQQGDQPGGDCNAMNPSIYSGAPEICGDNIDNNCDNHFDEGCKTCANDSQCAGQEYCSNGVCVVCGSSFDPSCTFGDGDAGVGGRRRDYGNGCSQCVPACDMDGDGFCGPPNGSRDGSPRRGDCDDMDFSRNPDAAEICGNAKDDDCDGAVDEFCGACAESMMCGDAQACTSGR